MGFDLFSERRGERQQAALVHMEAPVFVTADNVKGEGRSIPGCVFVRDHELEDAATDGLALLQKTGFITSINHRSSVWFLTLLKVPV